MLKKAVSLILIGSQLNWAFAAAGAPAPRTAEFRLLETVLALQGQKLSDQDLQARFKSAISQYSAVASTEGQQERLESALVDLGVYTPAEAKSFAAEAQTTASNGSSAEVVSREITKTAQSHPAGAQFSACDYAPLAPAASLLILVAGLTVVGLGSDRASDNPTCTSEAIGTAVDSTGHIITVYGNATCTQENYYPYKHQGHTEMEIGAAIAVAAVALFFATNAVCGEI